ncbi:MAG: hypothetical protein IJ150_10390 [Bacteroidales bacterium]|nr:hypothetical protein [Bacteroidales bacterium]
MLEQFFYKLLDGKPHIFAAGLQKLNGDIATVLFQAARHINVQFSVAVSKISCSLMFEKSFSIILGVMRQR